MMPVWIQSAVSRAWQRGHDGPSYDCTCSGAVASMRTSGSVVVHHARMREHVVDALPVGVEQRHKLRKRNQLRERAAPGLTGSDVLARLGDDLDLERPLSERLTVRCHQKRVVHDGEGEARQRAHAAEDLRCAAAHRDSNDHSDDEVDEIKNEDVSKVRPDAAADRREVERSADSGTDVKQLLGLARGAVRLATDFDEAIAAKGRAAPAAPAHPLRHIDMIPTDHRNLGLSWILGRRPSSYRMREERGRAGVRRSSAGAFRYCG